MTDGILLAEIQSDPMLARYDTIIVDEAHERSLNIDFILGYLARLLPQRPDLKVIITSATIDSARFAEHFGRAVSQVPDADAGAGAGSDAGAGAGAGAASGADAGSGAGTDSAPPAAWAPAPVIEVSGRTYPVEIRYRPLLADDAPTAGPGHTPRGASGHVPGDGSPAGEANPRSRPRRPAPPRPTS